MYTTQPHLYKDCGFAPPPLSKNPEIPVICGDYDPCDQCNNNRQSHSIHTQLPGSKGLLLFLWGPINPKATAVRTLGQLVADMKRGMLRWRPDEVFLCNSWGDVPSTTAKNTAPPPPRPQRACHQPASVARSATANIREIFWGVCLRPPCESETVRCETMHLRSRSAGGRSVKPLLAANSQKFDFVPNKSLC